MDVLLVGVGGQAVIQATWCNSGNLGDRLTPWLIHRMTGEWPVYVEHHVPAETYLAVGSVLSWAGPMTTVWGSGIMSRGDNINPLADIRAVRGPLSLEAARRCGAACPDVYGDPAILCPLYEQLEKTEPEWDVGFVPHYTDQHWFPATLPEGWTSLNVFDNIESFIAKMCRCRVVVGSSLHGLILADACEVPSVRVVIGDSLGGDGVKYSDYYESVGRDIARTLPWRTARAWSTEDLVSHADLGNVGRLQTPLLNACPWL